MLGWFINLSFINFAFFLLFHLHSWFEYSFGQNEQIEIYQAWSIFAERLIDTCNHNISEISRTVHKNINI